MKFPMFPEVVNVGEEVFPYTAKANSYESREWCFEHFSSLDWRVATAYTYGSDGYTITGSVYIFSFRRKQDCVRFKLMGF